MRLTVIVLLLSCTLAAPSRTVASNQSPAAVAGTWNVTIRMPGRTVSEQWTVQQKGTAVTGTAKGEHGELPVSGAIEGAFFRVTVKDGDRQYKVRATVDGDAMDGSITVGVGDAHLWFAKRPTDGKKSGPK
jgi:hypothetical protein